jgi:hypothetical protein
MATIGKRGKKEVERLVKVAISSGCENHYEIEKFVDSNIDEKIMFKHESAWSEIHSMIWDVVSKEKTFNF